MTNSLKLLPRPYEFLFWGKSNKASYQIYEIWLMTENGSQSACPPFTGVHHRVYMAGVFSDIIFTVWSHCHYLKCKSQCWTLNICRHTILGHRFTLVMICTKLILFILFHQYCQISYKDAVHRQVVSGKGPVWRATGVDESTRVWKSSLHLDMGALMCLGRVKQNWRASGWLSNI